MKTFAGLIDSRRVVVESAREVGLSPSDLSRVSVTAEGSSATQVITITVRSPDRRVSEQMALAVRRNGIEYFNSLEGPYRIRPVRTPGRTVFDDGLLVTPALQLLAAWTVGVIAFIMLARRSRRADAAASTANAA
jgi:hypothetical protein